MRSRSIDSNVVTRETLSGRLGPRDAPSYSLGLVSATDRHVQTLTGLQAADTMIEKLTSIG